MRNLTLVLTLTLVILFILSTACAPDANDTALDSNATNPAEDIEDV